MKKLSTVGLAVALGLSMNFAHADSLPQRFEGCFLEGSKICLFKDGTAISQKEINGKIQPIQYHNYKLVNNYDKFRHTNQALILTLVSNTAPYEMYIGNNDQLKQPFQLTFYTSDPKRAKNEIFVDDKKLDFSQAKTSPNSSEEVYFNFAKMPKTLILKQFIQNRLYHTLEYQLQGNYNWAYIVTNYPIASRTLSIPITYKNGELSTFSDSKKPHPIVLQNPDTLDDIWQDSLAAKAKQQRLSKKPNPKYLYADKNGKFAYRKPWDKEEAELTDEKIKNAGLIKLDLVTPTTVKSSVN